MPLHRTIIESISNAKIGRNLRKVLGGGFDTKVEEILKEVPIPDDWDTTTLERQRSLLETAITAGVDYVAPLKPRFMRNRAPISDPEVKKAERKCRNIKKITGSKRLELSTT